MNDKIISFISCVNNDIYYNQCLAYIDKLEVPLGYSIEKIDIRNASSLCSAYNEAMRSAQGKIKVYIHQDAGIVNTHFIYDILEVFKDKSVGLIGMVGTTFLDSSAIWWNRQDLCIGMVRHFCGINPIFRNPMELFEDVVAVDGLLLATQYDIPWREDVFKGFHFYDISQCMEFYKANLRVVVPRQEDIWVNHGFDARSANLQGYEESRLLLLREYDGICIRSAVAPTKEIEKIKEEKLKEKTITTDLKSDVKLYILTNTQCSFLTSESLVPIATTMNLGKNLNINSTDTLDNVSDLNYLLSEYSSFYWAWKNDKTSEFISFFRHHKYLILKENPQIVNEDYDYGWDSETVKTLFTEYDIIVPKKTELEMSVYEQYNICHTNGLLDKLTQVIKSDFPWVLESFEIALKNNEGYFSNLFVMRKSDFNNYMAFTFHIFEQLKPSLEALNEEKSFAYLGERLFNCYVEYLKLAEHFKVKEVEILRI